jgi:hypothetical protein
MSLYKTIRVEAEVDVDDVLMEIEPDDILDYIEKHGISRTTSGKPEDEVKYHLQCIKDCLFSRNGIFPEELKQAINDYIDNNFTNIIE